MRPGGEVLGEPVGRHGLLLLGVEPALVAVGGAADAQPLRQRFEHRVHFPENELRHLFGLIRGLGAQRGDA